MEDHQDDPKKMTESDLVKWPKKCRKMVTWPKIGKTVNLNLLGLIEIQVKLGPDCVIEIYKHIHNCAPKPRWGIQGQITIEKEAKCCKVDKNGIKRE